MKKNTVIYIVSALLFISIIANVWLLGTLRAYKYNASQGWFTYSREGVIEYPIMGIKISDIAEMKELVDSKVVGEFSVLSINVIDKNRVVITTGVHNAPLAGKGQFFRFKRVENKWVLVEPVTGWVS